MAYAEAGGDDIDDECMRLVLCAIKNRVWDPDSDCPHYPKAVDECVVVGQENGKQFNPYKCVDNPGYENQKYCKCCKGELTGNELQEYEDARQLLDNLDCGDFDANTFNNRGMNSWAKRNCEPVPVISFPGQPTCEYILGENQGEPVFDSYKCCPQ